MTKHKGKNSRGLALRLGAVAVVSFGAWLWFERRRPLRRANEDGFSRDARNLALAACGAVVTSLAESPLTLRMARRVETQRLGLLKQLALPRLVETAAACALLDYTLYGWHYLTHKLPLLWRCHVVHHADLDLSATTALRFHFAELLLSVPFRLAQVRVLGVSPSAFRLWQRLLFASVIFHHSNIRLPIEWERRLNRWIVTPRMHGIHHSIVREETDSNWSSGLTVWDWLHGTLRRDVPQQAITIGVPAYREPKQVTLAKTIAMPFVTQPNSWQLPESEERPARELQNFSR